MLFSFSVFFTTFQSIFDTTFQEKKSLIINTQESYPICELCYFCVIKGFLNDIKTFAHQTHWSNHASDLHKLCMAMKDDWANESSCGRSYTCSHAPGRRRPVQCRDFERRWKCSSILTDYRHRMLYADTRCGGCPIYRKPKREWISQHHMPLTLYKAFKIIFWSGNRVMFSHGPQPLRDTWLMFYSNNIFSLYIMNLKPHSIFYFPKSFILTAKRMRVNRIERNNSK